MSSDRLDSELALPEVVVRKVRELAAAGSPLNITAVKRHHPELIEAAYHLRPFWGWRRVLEDAGLDPFAITVHLEPFVECLLCGRPYRVLTSHLERTHGTSSEAYLAEFPGADLQSEEQRARRLGRARDGSPLGGTLPHWEPLLSREYVLDRIAEYGRLGGELSLTWCLRTDPALLGAADQYCGGWYKAVQAVSVDPAEVRRRGASKHWTREEVLAALRSRFEAGLAINVRALSFQDDSLARGILRHFGAFDAAFRAAGIDPAQARKQHARYSEEDRSRLIAAAQSIARLEGADRLRAVAELARHPRPIVSLFKNLRGLARAAGVSHLVLFRRAKAFRYPDAPAVLAALHLRIERGQPVRSGALRRGPAADLALLRAAERHFRSWEDALVAAGVSASA